MTEGKDYCQVRSQPSEATLSTKESATPLGFSGSSISKDPSLTSRGNGTLAPSGGTWRSCYPITRTGRRVFCTVAAVALLVIIAIVTTVGVTVQRSKDEDDAQPPVGFGDGHPLGPDDGGVLVGQPGGIATFGNRSKDFFVLRTNRSSFVTRMDPIVNPGGVSSHLHRVHGSSYFTPDLIKASEMHRLAKCSTTQVQKDLSLYWVPTVHYLYPNASVASIPIRYTSIYYFQKAPTGTLIHPFPDNFNLVVGNPNRRARNESNYVEQALFWYCFRGNGNDLKTWGFPESQCKDGLTSVVIFPSCWNGKEDATYSAHTAYPADGPNGYHCPAEFPRKLPTIQFETAFDVALFPYQPDRSNWVLANGDTSGLGIHGDFLNGWDTTTLQDVLDRCRYMNATAQYSSPTDPRNCPALNASYDLEAALSCRSQSRIVNEPVGHHGAIPHLPGCNAIWTGDVPRPACPQSTDVSEPGFVQPSFWYRNEGYVA